MLGLAHLVLAASSLGDPRQGTAALQVPTTGVGVEAATSDNRLSARFAFRAGSFTGDLSAAGAETNKITGRSALGDVLAPTLSGKLGLGVSYSNFTPNDFLVEQSSRKNACAAAWSQSPTLPDGGSEYGERIAEGRQKVAETAKDDAPMKQLNLEAQALERYFTDGGTDPGAVARLQVLRLQREVRMEELAKNLPSGEDDCTTDESEVPQKFRALLEYGPKLRMVYRVATDFGPQSTDFFDTGSGERKTDLVVPWSVSGGVGAYVGGVDLVGLTLKLEEKRSAEDATSICTDVPVAGNTASPPVYSCADAALDAPKWKSNVSARLEWRRYASDRVAFNPSVTATLILSRQATGLQYTDSGNVAIDLPVYVKVDVSPPAKDGDPDHVVVGAALGLNAKWEKGKEAKWTAGFSIFLGGLFSRLTP